MALQVCAKCGISLDDKNFYTYKNGQKFEICKKCITMHIDYFNPETFTWIMQKADIPYVPSVWNKIRNAQLEKDPTKLQSVMGKYISKMKLIQFKGETWADTEKWVEEDKKMEEELKNRRKEIEETAKEQLAAGVITEVQYKTMVNATEKVEEDAGKKALEDAVTTFFNEKDYMPEEELIDLSAELTQEDKLTLAMKWGRFYKGSEWVELERMYTEMTTSFDIQDADTENTLILICKTNLKMNQALDTGDIDTYQKLSRVSNELRKSAKFTAAQNKEDKDEYVDAAGLLVSYCEEHGGEIPEFKIEYDLDIVDKIIRDQKNYLKDLVYEDKALAQQIEDYIKKRQILDEKAREEAEAEKTGVPRMITDDEILEHKEMLLQMKEQDRQLLEGDLDES